MCTMCFGTHGVKKVSDLKLELQVVIRLPNGACFLFLEDLTMQQKLT